MSGEAEKRPQVVKLPVLSPEAKVDELRRNAQLPADAAACCVSHVNRSSPPTAEQQEALEQKIIAALRSVFDPEIPVNVYDLGLIYDILIDAENRVVIRMTLTAPGCPVADVIPAQVKEAVERIPEVKNAITELVWDPPWSWEMMSEAARLELGL